MPFVRTTLAARRSTLTLAAFLLAIVVLPSAIACTSKPKSSGSTFGSLSGSPAVPGGSGTAGVASSPPDDAAVAQFLLPKFSVSGNVVVKGVDPKTNEMLSPDNKDDVAYYDFSGHPGYGCPSAGKCANAVFSGHVDWYTKEVGVFWHLKDLNAGDEIDLKLADGVLFKYKVVANTIYKSSEAPVQEILGDTPQESVTLITCDGVFDKQLQEYNSRRIVRAVREA